MYLEVRVSPAPSLIEKSTLGNHAALAGGASVALSRLHLSLFTEGLKGVEIAVPPPSIETFKKGALPDASTRSSFGNWPRHQDRDADLDLLRHRDRDRKHHRQRNRLCLLFLKVTNGVNLTFGPGSGDFLPGRLNVWGESDNTGRKRRQTSHVPRPYRHGPCSRLGRTIGRVARSRKTRFQERSIDGNVWGQGRL